MLDAELQILQAKLEVAQAKIDCLEEENKRLRKILSSLSNEILIDDVEIEPKAR